jgi:hypothetical protein
MVWSIQYFASGVWVTKRFPTLQNCVLWLPFDEGSGSTAYDASGNGNNGTLVNSPSWVAGQFGDALQFSGSTQYVSLPTNVYGLGITNQATFCAWIYPTASETAATIFGDYASSEGMALRLNALASITFYIYPGNYRETVTYAFSLNTWYFIVAEMGADGYLHIFINGTEVGTPVTLGGNIGNSADKLNIGATGGGGSCFAGIIDDVRIYSTALSPQQISDLYKNNVDAVIDQAIDELNGQLELDFIIPNTPSNLAFVQYSTGGGYPVQLLWNSNVVFSGLLMAYQATFTQIECTVYNNTAEVMKKHTITGQYTNVAANTIFAAICAASGVTAGSCPSTVVSTQFNATDCYTAALNLANILGLNMFNSGVTVNIALKGNQTPTALTVDSQSSVSIDRSKAGYDGVIVRGVDPNGNAITGKAGNTSASYNVQTITNKVASSIATLNLLATYYLQALQETNSGCPLECDISQAAALNSGDLVTITNGTGLGLSGTYMIYKITKNLTKATINIVRPTAVFANLSGVNLDNLLNGIASSTTALNTMPVSSDQVQGASVSLQSLIGFYHLGEGSGTVATDNSPNTNNGTIGSGNTWIPGPETEVLTFNGNGSYVDISNTPNNILDFSGLSKFSFTAWFSPTVAASQYLVYKANQFYVQLLANGSIVFGLHIGGAWVTLTAPAGSAPLIGRLFVACIYDGTNMYMYLNGPVLVQQAQTGTIGSSTSDTYIGAQTASAGGFTGVIDEAMFFARVLGATEVYSLYFFPLITFVNVPTTVTVSNGDLYLTYATNIKSKYTVNLSYLLNSCILSGKVVVSSATGTMNCYEAGYVVLALLQYSGSSYYSQVQSILDLWASLQNSDGSWYQQYNPYSPYAVVTQTSEGTDGNLKVDSGAALLAWAMSNYDRLTSGTRYKANVQHALDFLRTLQYAHTVAYSSNLIANEILDGTTDTTALLADCAECLLSAKFAMDAYGASLATTSGYSVQTFANNLYYSIAVTGWRGNTAQYYDTSYPYGQNTNVPFTYEEKISYTQALCSWAVYVFAKSAYQTAGDFSSQCEICLSYINTLTRGSWGGEYYCPYTGAAGQTQNEYSGYAALMAIACQNVGSVTYASLIAGLISFIKWLTLNGGQVCDFVDVTGRVWRSQIGTTEDGFLVLPIALALLAGAGT